MPAPDGLNPHRGTTIPKRDETYHREAPGLTGEHLDALMRQSYTLGREHQRIEDGAQVATGNPAIFDQGWDAAMAAERERLITVVRSEVVDPLQAIRGVIEGSHLSKERKGEVYLLLRQIEGAMVKIAHPFHDQEQG